MILKYKLPPKIFFILIFLLLASLIPQFNLYALGLEPKLEIDYPQLIPDVPPPTTVKVGIPSYVRYLYVFIIVIAGFLSLLMLVIGGVRYVYSAGSPEKTKDAKNQINNAIFGLVILLCSFLILKTINPQLTTLQEPVLKEPFPPELSSGVYACNEEVAIPYFFNKRAELKQIYDLSQNISAFKSQYNYELSRLKEIQDSIDKKCIHLYQGANILPLFSFENKITWIYLVPVFGETEYGTFVFEERNYKGLGRAFFGNQGKGQDYALTHVTSWPIDVEKMGVSSILPFIVNRKPETSWYVKLYELVHFNRDDFEGKYKKKTCEKIKEGDATAFCNITGMSPTNGCQTSGSGNGDSDYPYDYNNDYQSPGEEYQSPGEQMQYLPKNKSLGFLESSYKLKNQLSQTNLEGTSPGEQSRNIQCPPKISSVNIEGDLLIIFFKEKLKKWTEKTEIFLVPSDDVSTYDDIMANWLDECKEPTPEEPEEGRRYPCAKDAVTISGKLLY